MPPPEPGAWAAGYRDAWPALRAELPRAEWPTFEAFWALEPGIPDELRYLHGLQAHLAGPNYPARRAAWLAAHWRGKR